MLGKIQFKSLHRLHNLFNKNSLQYVRPNLMIVCDKIKLDGKRCNGAPDFIMEIVSPGNASDDI